MPNHRLPMSIERVTEDDSVLTGSDRYSFQRAKETTQKHCLPPNLFNFNSFREAPFETTTLCTCWRVTKPIDAALGK